MDQETNTLPTRATNLVGVQLRTATRIYSCDAGQLALQSGEHVLVETEQGSALGTVIPLPQKPGPNALHSGVHRVIRKADARDLEKDDRSHIREREALRVCLQHVRDRGLQMKLIEAEQVCDGSKIVFYFAAEGRIDFRELVRDLAHTLHTRIEMKQIGARDETKLVGAVAPCGRELCCSSWLRDFDAVSVKMAKVQGLSLNPSKLAGMCGRLKCCLRYEYDTYVDLNRNLPALGSHVVSVKGDGVVTRQNPLRQTVVIRREDGVETEAGLADLVEKKAQ
jgi:cell fate regulator YaaT (PSP1 superfamily)